MKTINAQTNSRPSNAISLFFIALLVLVLATVIFGYLFSATAHAVRTRISVDERKLMSYAARDYWHSRMGPPNKDDLSRDRFATDIISLASCQPRNAKILYFYSGGTGYKKYNSNTVGFAFIKAAFGKEVVLNGQARENTYYNAKTYCKMWFNRNNKAFQDGKMWLMCEIYIHEYGHMLGLNHVDSRQSVMIASNDGKLDINTRCKSLFP